MTSLASACCWSCCSIFVYSCLTLFLYRKQNHTKKRSTIRVTPIVTTAAIRIPFEYRADVLVGTGSIS
eukprot:Gb_27839 [translate_table: standard]